jgi:glycerol-3-phosphate acyltransferase PlsX
MNIGLDVSGGDFAPKVNLLGAVQAKRALNGDSCIFLFGDETEIRNELIVLQEDASGFKIVHSPEIIGMDDHPTRAFSRKPRSKRNRCTNMRRRYLRNDLSLQFK